MFRGSVFSRRANVATAAFALLASLAPAAFAQSKTTAAQPRTQQTTQPATATTQPITAQPTTARPAAATTKPATAVTQTSAPAASGAQVASNSAASTDAAKAVLAPLYRDFKGVKLGMSAAEVRAKLGKPSEKSDAMDFYVFSDRERARVYYTDGKASAVIATYIGRDAGAPAPAAVLGSEIEAKPDGSMYRMAQYPQAGYWVAYSRTAGDSPMVMITMQKTP